MLNDIETSAQELEREAAAAILSGQARRTFEQLVIELNDLTNLDNLCYDAEIIFGLNSYETKTIL
jgi:hypothetical protein